ncbi:MAG TPA: glutathione S-transferase family protein [Caulobacteraceae bacterium]|nr:glutathione S-transferase family protein [Caulobacteraceae bacterium]
MITLYHCPNSRSNTAMYLLEELGRPYEVKVVDVRAGDGQKPEYLAINPMGKVPAIRDDDEVVSETGAIGIYLGDKYPEAGLAPPIGDPRRGAYLRWHFLNTSFDAVLVERMAGRPPLPAQMAGYGDYERVLNTLRKGLAVGPWLLGEQFTTVDACLGAGFPWGFANGTLPREPAFEAYAGRIEARPAYQRASARWGLANP